jgi:Pol polyprotein/LTR polyprotein gag-polypeptide-like protein
MSSDPRDKRLKLFKLEDDGEGRNNYPEYAVKNKSNLIDWELWKYLEENAPIIPTLIKRKEREVTLVGGVKAMAIEEGNEEEVEKAKIDAEPWVKGDRRTLNLIINSVPGHRLYLVNDAPSAKYAWRALKQEYQAPNSLKASAIRTLINSTRCTIDKKVEPWLSDMTKLFVELSTLDPGTLLNAEFARILTDNMPDYGEWVTHAALLRDERMKADAAKRPLSYQYITGKIRNANWAVHRHDPLELEKLMPELNRVTAEASRKRPSADSGQPQSKRPRPYRNPEKVCTNRFCEFPQGHFIADCISYGGGKVGQYWESWTGPRDIHLPPNQRGQLPNRGAINRSKAPAGPKKQPISNSSAGPPHRVDQSSIEPLVEISEAFSNEHPYPTGISVATCHPYALAASTPLSDSLYHDSGANRHIFYSRSSFTTYKEIDPIVCRGFESTLSATAIGVGDVTVRANYGNASTKVVLKNCLHIPKARQNLISQLELDNIGIGSNFLGDGSNHTLRMIYNGKVIATGQGNGDVPLYKINMFVVQSAVSLLTRVEPMPLANRISPISSATNSIERRDFSIASLGTFL